MSEQWKVICKVRNIPLLGALVVQRGFAWQELPSVAIFRTRDERVFALLDRCPCMHGPLSHGIVFGDRVACPLHNWSTDLASGAAGAPGEGVVKRYKVKVENGQVLLDIDELSAPASKAEAALAGSFAVATQLVAA
jgi:nitrite reductase (NADH) small subunit